MILLLILAETVTRTPAPPQAKAAEAIVRIERSVTVTRDQWSRTPARRRREITRRGPDGRIETIQVIEQE